MYIIRRRSGEVGPTPAPQFVKYTALYGVIQFVTHWLLLYLTPFNGQWLASVMRAIILIPASFGRQFPVADYLYSTHISPIFDANSREIEQYLRTLREKFSELDAVVRVLAEDALKRLSVGGLSALISLPSASQLSVTTGTVSGSAGPHDSHSFAFVDPQSRKDFLPQPVDSFFSSRPFFSHASDRADAIAISAASSASSLNLDPSISDILPSQTSQDLQSFPLQPSMSDAVLDLPKPAFERARALRRQFKQRAARAILKKGPT